MKQFTESDMYVFTATHRSTRRGLIFRCTASATTSIRAILKRPIQCIGNRLQQWFLSNGASTLRQERTGSFSAGVGEPAKERQASAAVRTTLGWAALMA